MAYKLIIRCPDAEEVIRLLKERHGADYSRIWRVYERTIGVFSFEWMGAFGGYVNLITLNHDKNLKKCEVTIIGIGGGFPSLDSIAGSDDPGKRAVKDLATLAEKKWLGDYYRESNDQISWYSVPHLWLSLCLFQGDD